MKKGQSERIALVFSLPLQDKSITFVFAFSWVATVVALVYVLFVRVCTGAELKAALLTTPRHASVHNFFMGKVHSENFFCVRK